MTSVMLSTNCCVDNSERRLRLYQSMGTEQNIVRVGKSEAEITNNKRLKMRSRYCTDEAKVAKPLCDSRAFCYTVYIVHCMGMQLSLNLHRLLCICNDNDDDDDDDARNGSETCPWNVYGIAD